MSQQRELLLRCFCYQSYSDSMFVCSFVRNSHLEYNFDSNFFYFLFFFSFEFSFLFYHFGLCFVFLPKPVYLFCQLSMFCLVSLRLVVYFNRRERKSLSLVFNSRKCFFKKKKKRQQKKQLEIPATKFLFYSLLKIKWMQPILFAIENPKHKLNSNPKREMKKKIYKSKPKWKIIFI